MELKDKVSHKQTMKITESTVRDMKKRRIVFSVCDIPLVRTFINQPSEMDLLGAVSQHTTGFTQSTAKQMHYSSLIRLHLQHASTPVTVRCFRSRAQRILILNLHVVLLSADIRQFSICTCLGY